MRVVGTVTLRQSLVGTLSLAHKTLVKENDYNYKGRKAIDYGSKLSFKLVVRAWLISFLLSCFPLFLETWLGLCPTLNLSPLYHCASMEAGSNILT